MAARKASYKLTAWKPQPGGAVPVTRRYDDPVEALTGGIVHLLQGFQVRLSDPTIDWFREHPTPLLEALPDAARALRAQGGSV